MLKNVFFFILFSPLLSFIERFGNGDEENSAQFVPILTMRDRNCITLN